VRGAPRSGCDASPYRTPLAFAALLLVLLTGAVVVAANADPFGNASARRARCSPNPALVAAYVIPPPPFEAKLVSVRRLRLPPGEPAAGGPQHKRLYQVTFRVLRGNAVLPAGHRYSQFAYVTRKTQRGRWCFLKGGSGP
jgi:hypothetical protein